ncbi:DUF4440 domain-containing protein [Tsukamurella pulmonis]|nr:DUF4440 domain-containing protein [Tsukamurella pulmonis]
MPESTEILGLVERWRQAELSGDDADLAAVLASDFVGVGPMGWLRTKDEWVEKYRSGVVSNDRFDLVGLIVVSLSSTSAIVVADQAQAGRNGAVSTDGRFRFSLTVGTDNLIHSIHVTRIVEPK